MKKEFPISKTIKERYSARTFTDKKITAETKELIFDYAKKLENPLGPGIRIQWLEKETAPNGEKLGTYGIIKGASNFLGVTVPNEPYAMEALGYEFEELVLYITSLSLGTCWMGGTFDRNSFTSALTIEENELFPIISPIGYPTEKKRMGEKLFRRTINADNRRPASELFLKEDFKTPLSENEIGKYKDALENLRLAPSAVNGQPWRVVYKDGAFHFFEKHTMKGENGVVDMQRIDLGIGICHFHLTAMDQNLNGSFVRDDNHGIAVPADTTYIISWKTEQ